MRSKGRATGGTNTNSVSRDGGEEGSSKLNKMHVWYCLALALSEPPTQDGAFSHALDTCWSVMVALTCALEEDVP